MTRQPALDALPAPLGFLRPLLPSSVQAYDTFGSASANELPAVEQQYVRGAVPSRRREFATGRFCARRALAGLGHAQVAIPATPQRDPSWPAGVVGSITHTANYCAAAVARKDDVLALGIDAEVAEPLPAEVLPITTTATERKHLENLQVSIPDVPWSRLVFAAKEAVYKAWFPRTRQWLDFDEVEVVFSLERNTFTASLPGLPMPHGPMLTHVTGSWLMESGILLATVVVGG